MTMHDDVQKIRRVLSWFKDGIAEKEDSDALEVFERIVNYLPLDERTFPHLSDEAWDFLKNMKPKSQCDSFVVFEGDFGNWNWLFSEIMKRCNKTKSDITNG